MQASNGGVANAVLSGAGFIWVVFREGSFAAFAFEAYHTAGDAVYSAVGFYNCAFFVRAGFCVHVCV